MAGFQALNEEVEGTLEILKGGKVIEALEKASYEINLERSEGEFF